MSTAENRIQVVPQYAQPNPANGVCCACRATVPKVQLRAQRGRCMDCYGGWLADQVPEPYPDLPTDLPPIEDEDELMEVVRAAREFNADREAERDAARLGI